ncbi:MAG TPA: efflux RND transporter periplasmic adaptor subunit [Gemmatimonadales bacterium]|nr:efflux RND transporter periplasmic adaptor subunit [Gemmatimonadales bacterium]
MGTAAPRLRDDLIISRRSGDGAEQYIVKDPRSGAFFRLREAEHFIAGQLDGTTPLAEVRERTEQRFDASLSPEGLEAFVARLRGSGLLERPGHKPRSSRRRRLRGSLLYLRVPLLDPDKILDRVVGHTRFLFTPGALGVAALLCLIAGWITVLQGAAIRLHLVGASAGTLLLVAVGILLASVSMHEGAHGIACKHFGGAVHEMGFMLIYFQPAFYCNVSDAWLLPEKAKRLWISFAGIIFELTLWAVGTIVWRVTEQGTWPNFLALALLTTAGVKTLLNLNPFIKLDGYYILSDWLDIPNLRRKAFRYIGDHTRALFGFPVERPMVTTARERRIFTAYGLVSTATSALLIGYILMQMSAYLVEMHRPSALAMLGVAVGLKVRRRFRRLFGNGNSPSDPGDDEPPALEEPSEGELPPRPPDAPTPTRTDPDPALTRRRLWIAAAVAFVAYLCFGRMQLKIGGPFSLLPERSGEVRTEVDGIVSEILVDEGEDVHAGDPIARLLGRDLAVEHDKTAAALAEARANLRKLEAGPTQAELEVARAGAARARARLEYAEAGVRRISSLVDLNSATRQELETAQEAATTAANDLAEAQGRLHVLEQGNRPEDIAAVRAQVEQLNAQEQYLTGQLRLITVVSGVSGTVATPERELRAMKGQHVEKGALIARVFSYRTIVAQIVIPEQEIADIQVGQPVVLRARAFPERVFTGRVTAIATAALGAAGTAEPLTTASSSPIQSLPVRSFLVTTAIDNEDLLLRPGMTGHVKVLGGEHPIIGLIARRLARVLKVEVWSWW